MLLSKQQLAFLDGMAELSFTNPFLASRLEAESRLLGRRVRRGQAVWAFDPRHPESSPDLEELRERLAAVIEPARAALAEDQRATPRELECYEDAVLYLLYDRYRDRLSATDHAAGKTVRYWPAFEAEFEHYLRPGGRRLPTDYDSAHVLACFFQLRRAFTHIFKTILGRSPCIARLRAACWQSVFTHDLRAYYRGLFARMEEFTTLIVGPTGTGKELVASAIGRCRYIPFDPQRKRFEGGDGPAFFAVNPSALAPALIESELFGHARGAFTGAASDHAGYFESCPKRGTVFLDEIGELDVALQVKLLRVLQSRQFTRLGETKQRSFTGKLIAATHQDLAAMIDAGRFREDFYYRLCSDVVTTPSLAEMVAADPGDLDDLVRHLAGRITGGLERVEPVAERVMRVIDKRLGSGYAWPGNIRELEQCVRSVLIRGDYEPRAVAHASAGRHEQAWRAMYADAEADSQTVLRHYARRVHQCAGTYVAAAERLGLDRRTVKRLVETPD